MHDAPLVLDSVLERSRARESGFDCFREGPAHRVQLWGRLPPAWAGNLALHAYSAQLHIATGDAARAADGIWAASFLLRAADPTSRVRYDFLRMARRAPRVLADLPEPDVSIGVAFSATAPGEVYAHVEGRDSIGLLAVLLQRFGAFGLRPRRFTLRTHGDDVHDWLWLEPALPPPA